MPVDAAAQISLGGDTVQGEIEAGPSHVHPELGPFVGHCRVGDCRHDREPGCALREALDRGEIGQRRFASYLKLRSELEGGAW